MLINCDGQVIDIAPYENLTITSYILGTSQDTRIASVFVEIQASKIDYVLLFSHGNATDLGYMLDTYLGKTSFLFLRFSLQFQCKCVRLRVLGVRPEHGQVL
jgi:hypothetical protein